MHSYHYMMNKKDWTPYKLCSIKKIETILIIRDN
jgi:hypothetical protein